MAPVDAPIVSVSPDRELLPRNLDAERSRPLRKSFADTDNPLVGAIVAVLRREFPGVPHPVEVHAEADVEGVAAALVREVSRQNRVGIVASTKLSAARVVSNHHGLRTLSLVQDRKQHLPRREYRNRDGSRGANGDGHRRPRVAA